MTVDDDQARMPGFDDVSGLVSEFVLTHVATMEVGTSSWLRFLHRLTGDVVGGVHVATLKAGCPSRLRFLHRLLRPSVRALASDHSRGGCRSSDRPSGTRPTLLLVLLNDLRARVEQPGRPKSAHSGSPLFLLRPERSEVSLLRAHPADLHGVVLLGRLLAPYREDSVERKRDGLRGDELAQLVRGARIDHIQDPDTAVLPLLTGNEEKDRDRFRRARLMASAEWVPPGAQADALDHVDDLHGLVTATLRPQVEVAFRSPPYFRFSSLDDPWLGVNVRAAARTQALDRGRAIATFAQVDVSALRRGVLAQAATKYAAGLATPGVALLQVAGLRADLADGPLLAAYLEAVEAWSAAGFSVIADKVNRFGAAAVGAGAAGMASGTRVYRNQPDDQAEFQYARASSIHYWAPGRGDSLLMRVARERSGRPSLPECPVANCDVLTGALDNDELRWHNVHLAMLELEQAQAQPHDFALNWQRSPRRFVQAWGLAMSDAVRRREES